MKYTLEELHIACENMQKFGGSFASSLGKAMTHADSINLAKIVDNWGDLIDEYKNFKTK